MWPIDAGGGQTNCYFLADIQKLEVPSDTAGCVAINQDISLRWWFRIKIMRILNLTFILSTRLLVLSISASMSRGSQTMSWFTFLCGLMMIALTFALCLSSLYTYFLRGLWVVHCSYLTRKPVPAGRTNHARLRLHRSRMKVLWQGSSSCSTDTSELW